MDVSEAVPNKADIFKIGKEFNFTEGFANSLITSMQ